MSCISYQVAGSFTRRQTTSVQINHFFIALLIFSLTLLSGCGSSHSSDVTIGGYVIDGPISGSSVTLHRVNTDGSAGEQVAGPFATDDNGQWNGSIPNGITGTLVVVASGGQYIDDATGAVVVLAANESLNSWFDTAEPDVKGVVSPVTDSLWQVARQGMRSGETLEDSIATAERIATAFWGVDPIRTIPDTSSGTDINQQYGAMLGGFSFLMANRAELQLEPFVSMGRFALTRLIMDDMADGKLDGVGINGLRLAAADGTLFPVLSANDLSAFFTEVNNLAEGLQIAPLGDEYFQPYPPIFNCNAQSCSGFTIGGSVSGLNGSLVLQNNAGDDLTITSDSAFTFATAFQTDVTYAVSILSSPAEQTCTLSNQNGTVASENITNITVTCAAIPTYTIGGTVTGLTGSLTLQNNAGDDQTITADGTFIFNTQLQSASAYSVTIQTSPAAQNCSITSGATGTVNAGNITSVQINCTDININVPTYTIGGSVSGLNGSLVLQNNATDNKAITTNGGFSFNTGLETGNAYSVSIQSSPATQTCSITSGASGSVGSTNITTVQISCSDIPTYTIGGTVSGLTGSLMLQNNSGDNKTVTGNGTFAFSTALQSGSTYSVSIQSSPATQTCSITSGASGSVDSANITSVQISCSDITYTIGGTVSGLNGVVVLKDSVSGIWLSVSADGVYALNGTLLTDANYIMTVDSQPAAQDCTVVNETGTVSNSDITNIDVTCVDKTTFTVGGTVTGLVGSLNIALQYGDTLTINGDGTFVFATTYPSGNYRMFISSTPREQDCTATNDTGTVNGADITDITVTCANVAGQFSIGGTVSGLTGTLELTGTYWVALGFNSGPVPLSITANGAYTIFPETYDNDFYDVKISAQPNGQQCYLSSGAGRVNNFSVSNINVTCFDYFGYYSTAEKWNYYVLNDGTNDLDASDTACTVTDTGKAGCIHGGMMRVIKVPSLSATVCGTLTAEDALGALNWTCKDDTGQVRFISTGLKDNKRLYDLVELVPGSNTMTQTGTEAMVYGQGQWKLNSLIVSNGYTSPEAKWWINDVRFDLRPMVDSTQTGRVTLTEADAVYSFTQIIGDGSYNGINGNRGSRAYVISGDHASIAVNPAISLPARGVDTYFISHTSDFNWVEGSFTNNKNQNSLSSGSRFSIFRYLTINDMGQYGMTASGSNNSYQHIALSSLRGSPGESTGFGLRIRADYSRFDDIQVINNGYIGVDLIGSFNYLSNMMLSNNSFALSLKGNSNTISNTVSANNDRNGIRVDGDDNILLNITSAKNADNGIFLNGDTATADNNVLMNVVAIDNNKHGITAESATGLTLVNIGSSNNGNFTDQMISSDGSGINLSNSSVNASGLLKVGGNSDTFGLSADCSITTSTGLAADCSASGLTVTQGLSLSESLIGRVFTDDIVNSSDNNGFMNFGASIDWINFENKFRTWGGVGLASLDVLGINTGSFFNRGRFGCISLLPSSWLMDEADCITDNYYWHKNGAISDYRLKSSDTLLRAVLQPYLNGDSASTITQTWSDNTTTTFLKNATEISGNNNGLCESNETCLYTPNMGAYQGFGNIISAGTFVNGDTLTGITLLKYKSLFSANANLSNLQISDGSLAPAFAVSQTTYTVSVSNSIASITVTPTLDDSKASVTVDGSALVSATTSPPFALTEGVSRNIPIVVTAENGTTKSYTISVLRSALLSSDASLSSLVLSVGSLSPAFNTAVSNYTSSVAFTTTSFTVAPGASDVDASISVNGVVHDANTIFTLNQGQNIFTIDVTATDGTLQTYTLAVTRQLAADYAEQAYIKASNAESNDLFANSGVSISGDTMAVGAADEDSNATTINGDQGNAGVGNDFGAVYVFSRNAGIWSQTAYIKMPYIDYSAKFGRSVSLSGDMLAVGARGDNSSIPGSTLPTGISGADFTKTNSGAVFIYTRDTNGDWSLQARLKASNTDKTDYFGESVMLSGSSLAVGAPGETSNATGTSGDESDNSTYNAGAVYVFTYIDNTADNVYNGSWSQQAYIKASNTGLGDQFGITLALDGDTLAVGATGESSNSITDEANDSLVLAGAVYVFSRSGASWSQQAYIKPSNPGEEDEFGRSLALSGDTLVVGAPYEDSNSAVINTGQTDNSFLDSGAVYIFIRSGINWSQQAYLKAPNSNEYDQFGFSVSLSNDLLAVGAPGELGIATTINGDMGNTTLGNECCYGAAYLFTRNAGVWSYKTYLKASNTMDAQQDNFGSAITLDGSTVVVGAGTETNAAAGVNVQRTDNSAYGAGAVHVFQPL